MADSLWSLRGLLLNLYTYAFCFLAYLVILAVYRLVFHPLARFPGPKIAALTRWYEFYYDVVLQGQYNFKIRELHAQYGKYLKLN